MGKQLRKNNLSKFQEEDEFLYAIKESEEIEFDMYMRLRDNQTDPEEKTQKDNIKKEEHEQNDDDGTQDKSNEQRGNDCIHLSDDYISLF